MNIFTFKKLLAIQTTKFFAWQDDPQSSEVATLTTDIRVRGIDDNVVVHVSYSDKGMIVVTMIFDRLEPTEDNLLLVNNFNANVYGLRATIQQKGAATYLVIEQSTGYPLDEQAAVDFVFGVISNINSDSTIRYLEPLTVITK